MSRLPAVLDAITATMSDADDRGQVATYIPELAKIDPKQFGIAVATADGSVHVSGDAGVKFSIQSVSKVFALTMALGVKGEALWNRVGMEPSGAAFNSIVQLESESGIPRNPFINAGALVVTDILMGGAAPKEVLGAYLRFMRQIASDDDINIDKSVAKSELATGSRNAALAHFLKAHGNIDGDVDKVIGTYFHLCATAMSCRQLAAAGRFLAFGGHSPGQEGTVVSPLRVRQINSVMLTCGHYDGSGRFAFKVGLPAKSGVGGGILAIAPGNAAIAVFSPGLDQQGNSLLGTKALEILAREMNWSIFGDQRG